MKSFRHITFVVLAVALAGCSFIRDFSGFEGDAGETTDAGDRDAGIDAGSDGGADAGTDAGLCSTPLLDCTADPGCETNSDTDADHCGMCGRACPWGCNLGSCDPPMAVVAGYGFTCALRESGAADCWGYNVRGQLGDGTVDNRSRPARVSGLSATVIDLGDDHTCARISTGAVHCWGSNEFLQLGDSTAMAQRNVPGPVGGIADAQDIAMGFAHGCALRAGGSVACWGLNEDGQLGDNTRTNRSVPVPVMGLSDAEEIVAGHGHTCARRSGGSVVCWGDNIRGQLGDGSTTDALTPVVVMGITDAVELAAGDAHTCARLPSGGVVCWGYNVDNELGDGTQPFTGGACLILCA